MKNIHVPVYAWNATTVLREDLTTFKDGKPVANTPRYTIETEYGQDATLVLTACGKIVPYQQTLLNRDLGLSKTTCKRCDTNAH